MLKGQTVTLRVVQERDLDTLFALLSDVANRGDYYPVELTSESRFRRRFAETGFWEEDYGRLLIVDEVDRILGQILFFRPVPYYDALEIAYLLFDEASRGRGLMTEALSLLVNHLFQTKKVHRLQLTVMVGNAASRRVAEKCGFGSEGIVRQAVFHRGGPVDLEMFSLLRSDLAPPS